MICHLYTKKQHKEDWQKTMNRKVFLEKLQKDLRISEKCSTFARQFWKIVEK